MEGEQVYPDSPAKQKIGNCFNYRIYKTGIEHFAGIPMKESSSFCLDGPEIYQTDAGEDGDSNPGPSWPLWQEKRDRDKRVLRYHDSEAGITQKSIRNARMLFKQFVGESNSCFAVRGRRLNRLTNEP